MTEVAWEEPLDGDQQNRVPAAARWLPNSLILGKVVNSHGFDVSLCHMGVNSIQCVL